MYSHIDSFQPGSPFNFLDMRLDKIRTEHTFAGCAYTPSLWNGIEGHDR